MRPGTLGLQLAWRAYAAFVLHAAASAGDLDAGRFSMRIAPGFLPMFVGYAALFVIMFAPAAAVYRRLTDPDAAGAATAKAA